MKSRIIIGDVHGSYKTLIALVAQLPVGTPITFVGDLIDRGPESRKVVDFVISGGYDCVRGNHEQMMIEYADDTAAPEYKDRWTDFAQNGGLRTLQSYDNFPEDIKLHVDWMRALPVYIEYPELKNEAGRYLVVSHSGLGHVWNRRNEAHYAKQFESQVIWDRDRFEDVPEIYNVYGHTPKSIPLVKSFYANIDTGACFKARADYGKMTALEFPTMKIYTQENVDV